MTLTSTLEFEGKVSPLWILKRCQRPLVLVHSEDDAALQWRSRADASRGRRIETARLLFMSLAYRHMSQAGLSCPWVMQAERKVGSPSLDHSVGTQMTDPGSRLRSKITPQLATWVIAQAAPSYVTYERRRWKCATCLARRLCVCNCSVEKSCRVTSDPLPDTQTQNSSASCETVTLILFKWFKCM